MRFKSISSDLLVTIVTLVAAFAAVTAAMASQEPAPGFERYNQAYPEPYAYPLAHNITRVSVASDGTQAYSSSMGGSSISANGRYVTFSSGASNLVSGDTNGYSDIFVHDRQSGETSRVSVASDGSQAVGYSVSPFISADGRYITFYSSASNLVAGDTNEIEDVFVHDRQSGETSRVSVASDGAQTDYPSTVSSISADGRYVTFYSWATNLVPGDTNEADDIFVHDRQTGETVRISVASDGAQADSGAGYWGTRPTISADGRYVVFSSWASTLVVGDTNDRGDIFVHDRQTEETTRISVVSDGAQANDLSWSPTISADGRYMAFASLASNLVAGDTNEVMDIFVHDRQTGETTRVSFASDGSQLNVWSEYPTISADGRYVAFGIQGSDPYYNGRIFIHDRQTGQTKPIPSGPQGFQPNGSLREPSISADGRAIAFDSSASNLVAGDTNGVMDVFVYDTLGKTAPANRAGNQPLALTLSWHDDDDTSVGYNFCIGRVKEVCDMIGSTENTSITLNNLSPNTTYYWQVRRVEDHQLEADGGAWWSFTTLTPFIPAIGSVSIASDQNVVAVARPHLGSEVASYIGSAAGATTQYVPMLFKGAFGGTYNAALYLQNVSASAATLSLEFTDSSGAVVYTKADTLDPHASKGYWLPAEVDLPNGFAGGVKVSSSQPILAVGRPHIGAQVMTYNGMSSGATTAWLPMFFKNGFGSYNTALYIQNLTSSSADLTIDYINLDGTVACTDEDTQVDDSGQGGLETLQVRAAFLGPDVVGEGVDVFLVPGGVQIGRASCRERV